MIVINEQELKERAAKIKLLLLDVDGVLTDGRLYFSADGVESKAFNTLDGHGLKLLKRSGVEAGIITGRTSAMVKRRAKDLGISLLKQGREDKFVALQELLSEQNFELDSIAYMGDDYPDLSVMTKIGLALCPANAHPAVRQRSHWQSENRGGKGAVREACDLIMQAQGTYQSAIDQYIG